MNIKSLKLASIYLLSASFFISGCVPSQYQKTIAVTKDATGKIVSTTETESVVQPNNQGWPVKFEHLKGVQPN